MDTPGYSVPTAGLSEDVSGMHIGTASGSTPGRVPSKASEDHLGLSRKDLNPPGRGSGQSTRLRGGARKELPAEGEGASRSGAARGDRGRAFGPSSRSNQQHTHYPSVDPARVVKRPIPETQNTRQFQLSQLQRRFRFQEGDHALTSTKTEFPIHLAPSDPEFPYNVDILKFVLEVPLGYGTSIKGGGSTAGPVEGNYPHIRVLNEDIPMGFRINIENGFMDIAKNSSRETTLLDMVNTLDKRLEGFLAAEKASTIKIIRNAPKKAGPTTGSNANSITGPRGIMQASNTMGPIMHLDAPPAANEEITQLPTYTADELSTAAARREQDIHRLEARLGKSNFSKTEAPDGELIYTVPLEARKRDLLPDSFINLQSVILRVPKYFNLQPCIIKIPGPEAAGELSRALEQKFTKLVLANPDWSLMAHLNALAANLHVMATEVMEDMEAEKRKKDEKEKELMQDTGSRAIISHIDASLLTADKEGMGLVDDDKEHIVVISRPPEWSYIRGEEDQYDESDTEGDSDYVGISEDDEKKQEVSSSEPPRERGTALSFPGIQMLGIQLLEVLFISITIKCSKCKTTTDIIQIRPGGKPRFDRCEKCSGIFGIGFRMEPVHQFSNRAGFFDLTGCTITEILPSNFLPHCASCDTPLPPPGLANLVPGQTTTSNCRQCYHKMNLLIPEMKLLRISQDDDENPRAPLPPKKAKKEERLVAGTELPNRGKCVHYRKSTRWFRFSCCLKVYPCDKCHDEQQPSHPAEHANRMICGRCSREQNFRPSDCAYCGHEFLRRQTGYWEGGKGTRDKRLLRRNDPRKYKRQGKPTKEK